MSDIHKCISCGEPVYMDNAEQCIHCESWFCHACDNNGVQIWSDEEGEGGFICKDCLEEGLEAINSDNTHCIEFTQKEFDEAVEDYNKHKIE